MPLTTRLIAEVRATLTSTATTPDLGTATVGSFTTSTAVRDVSLATGTAVGQADRMFSDTRTIAASSNDDLDLAGALPDALGGTTVFVKVKGLYIAAATGNTNNVLVGAGTNPWVTALNSTGVITLRPGAVVMLAAGVADNTAYGVTAATADILRIANSGAGSTVSYDIVIVGTSA